MKNLNTILFAAALTATFSFASNASAQFKPTTDDGITASPKVRQMLNERAASRQIVSVPAVTVTYRNPADGVTGSPKVLQMLAERKVVVSGSPAAEVASAAYRPTGADGVTASPKLRAQLGERSTPIIIAPLK
ncbi:MAG: hypothetical protein ACREIC_20200 [Limisphaerales bacterium]